MFEKNLEMSFLLDFYGDVLNERRRTVMSMYYNEDLSLSEIADEIGISRQGVRDLIKKSEEELLLFEEKLGLAQKFSKVESLADELEKSVMDSDISEEIKEKIVNLAEQIKSYT